MITFQSNDDKTVTVFLDNKNVGFIKQIDSKWYYKPKTGKTSTQGFFTLGQCKKSLLED